MMYLFVRGQCKIVHPNPSRHPQLIFCVQEPVGDPVSPWLFPNGQRFKVLSKAILLPMVLAIIPANLSTCKNVEMRRFFFSSFFLRLDTGGGGSDGPYTLGEWLRSAAAPSPQVGLGGNLPKTGVFFPTNFTFFYIFAVLPIFFPKIDAQKLPGTRGGILKKKICGCDQAVF